jgi:hypothetical protein
MQRGTDHRETPWFQGTESSQDSSHVGSASIASTLIPPSIVGMDPFRKDELTDADQDECDPPNDVDHAFGPFDTN